MTPMKNKHRTRHTIRENLRRTYHPFLESLEGRHMFFCPAEPFTVSGTSGKDTILIHPAGTAHTDVMITVNGAVSGPCRPASEITINGLGGNDTITIASSILLPTTIDGGPGSDTVKGGSAMTLSSLATVQRTRLLVVWVMIVPPQIRSILLQA